MGMEGGERGDGGKERRNKDGSARQKLLVLNCHTLRNGADMQDPTSFTPSM